jgi:hypothetical protein
MRRQKLGARGSERFRNYGEVLERHEKEMRIRKIVRVFSLLFIIMIIVMLIVIVVRIERKVVNKSTSMARVNGHVDLRK